jgi:hypothetical protein
MLFSVGMSLAAALSFSVLFGGCTTTKRAAQLVVNHHVGMARGAIDILSGEAEAREQRVERLRADLQASSLVIATEEDPARLLHLLRQHVALQDALLSELLPAAGHHQHGRERSQIENDGGDTEPLEE